MTPQIGDIWLCHCEEGDFHFLILDSYEQTKYRGPSYAMIELESGWRGNVEVFASHIGKDWEFVA